MDFRNIGQDDPSFLDLDVAAEISNLETASHTLGMDWDRIRGGVGTQCRPAASAIPDNNAIGYPPVRTIRPFGGFGTLNAAALRGLEARRNGPHGFNANTQSMLTLAQNSSRAARNGREQQRAQKISDFIDKLKGMLDRANVTSGDSTSKLNVLTRCEGYVRSLQDRTKCYELEARLRSVARGGHASSQDGGEAGGGNDIDWAKSTEDLPSSEGSRSGETDNPDGASSGRENESSSSNTIRDMARSTSSNEVVRPGSAGESGAGSGPEEDGDTGSTDSAEQRSADTTDSASQGFTTDSASRDFGTDSGYGGSSLGGDSGSADSGDAGIGDSGSADGGSEGSEEGSSRARMRVANYFDIFRLSNVPMAIADKDGMLVDVNDAMRGFGRINDETVKTLTVRSLVASESSKALEDAMAKMLSSEATPQDPSVVDPGLPPEGIQPFLVNANIGDRPTHLTLSLVYDEHGEASAFHIALIPRTSLRAERPTPGDLWPPRSLEYSGEPRALPHGKVTRWPGMQATEGGVGIGVGVSITEGSAKRGASGWDTSGRTTKLQKR